MTPAGAHHLPDGRAFAGWLRQLGPVNPTALLAARLPVWSVEAAVLARRPTRGDDITCFLLRAIPESPAVDAGRCLPAAEGWLAGAIAELLRADLIATDDGRRFTLTRTGREARDAGAWTAPAPERRTFSFLDLRPAAALRPVNPAGWPLQATSASPADAAAALAALRDAVGSDASRKQELGFPDDVADVLGTENGEWRNVPVVRGFRLNAAIVEVEGEGGRQWHLYAVRPGWIIAGPEPLVRIAAGAAVADDALRDAWRDWCAARRVAAAEADRCRPEIMGPEMRIAPPGEASGELRAAAEEIGRGDVWLTADAGPFRRAVRLGLSTPATAA